MVMSVTAQCVRAVNYYSYVESLTALIALTTLSLAGPSDAIIGTIEPVE